MIDIQCLGSSSAGNAYRITDGRTALLLEAGFPYKSIQRTLHFRMTDIAGCLISHEHGDHSRAAADIMRAGIPVYTSSGTADALGLSGHRLHTVTALQPFEVGSWTIMPFGIEHDAAEPLGFLLANQDGDKLVFLTDSYYCRYKFQGLTHIMIECNYSLEIVNRRVLAGELHPAQKKRLLRSHFSLEHVKDFLKANDTRNVEEIWLLHLSDGNSDAELFKREIQELTGAVVRVADR
ncbi:Phosphoribosyl 1,2-cyclic phosphodiesterase [Paenibacillus sophorae]|uniref:MBL fold metallo-hydrolase n=1 Tax=Paenibacillus sophorae TaxID=1333845 RepID=A0A1H8LCF3_9BACL|nr:MBL fold metallo-hydrolase [Paenibacillus sophorae]QWU17351.1 MBL fold metallo-hydrolase [Paenibacillus sophorae]SEO02418.1 Phosphoribosyl 1,2-cyclic phosphodiesterase [Paenibacillus sophorae]